MANIKIKSLGALGRTNNQQIYADMALDLEFGYTKNPELGKDNEIQDAVISYDRRAVMNSLHNLFNTSPGERPLTPEFGLNLKKFLFLPVDEFNAQLIGDLIIEGVRRFEPRVRVTGVTIIKDEDANQYEVIVAYAIPLLGADTTFTSAGTLSNSGFKFN